MPVHVNNDNDFVDNFPQRYLVACDSPGIARYIMADNAVQAARYYLATDPNTTFPVYVVPSKHMGTYACADSLTYTAYDNLPVLVAAVDNNGNVTSVDRDIFRILAAGTDPHNVRGFRVDIDERVPLKMAFINIFNFKAVEQRFNTDH